MRWQQAVAAVAGAASLALTGAASAQAVTGASSPWGKLVQIPPSDTERPTSLVCVSAGNCSATLLFSRQLSVITESKGHWGKPVAVPGLTALKGFSDLFEATLSCSTRGNCAVGGDYIGPRDGNFAFVASEINGVWHKALAVPGLAALKTGRDEELPSLSCSPGGNNCVAAGWYEDDSGSSRGFNSFVVSEKNGHWGKALALRGLSPSKFVELKKISCGTAGNCSAGGTLGGSDAFVVSEKNGTWGKTMVVPGLSALDTGNEATVDQMSCPSAGNCTAGGNYFDTQDDEFVWVATEKNGTWGTATTVPGLNALAAGAFADVQAISCVTAGDCAASGTYQDGTVPGRDFQGWVATEKNGTWGSAIELPNLAALNTGKNVEGLVVSCASPGNCAAGGSFALTHTDESNTNAFLDTEVNGAWGKATLVPGLSGLSALDQGSAFVENMSCPPAAPCTASGSFVDHSGHDQGFVISQK